MSHRTGARWSGGDDELKKAWTRQLQRLRDARRIRPHDDSTRRVEERRASATQRAAAHGARGAARAAAAQLRAEQRRARLVQQEAEDARRKQLTEQRHAARQLAEQQQREQQRERQREQKREQRDEQKLARLNAQRAKQSEAFRRAVIAAADLRMQQREQHRKQREEEEEEQRRRHVRIIKFDNLNVDTRKHGKLSNATVLLLESEAVTDYPTSALRCAQQALQQAGFEYVRGINGRVGLDRWLRVITDDEDKGDVKREVGESLTMCGHTFEHINGRA